MQINPFHGVAVAFEGIDGSSKTTQAKKITQYLEDVRGVRAMYTYEPWWDAMTENDTLLKAVLEGEKKLDFFETQKLFLDNRERHIAQKLIPFLKQQGSRVAVVDRFCFSTIAYGIATTDYPIETFVRMHNEIKDFFLPDVTILLDVPPEVGLKRVTKGNRSVQHVYEKKELLDTIRRAYLEVTAYYKENEDYAIQVIDATGDEEHIFSMIQPLVDQVVEHKLTKKATA